jgi:drug/metabolite transporter (DMT)-like permease
VTAAGYGVGSALVYGVADIAGGLATRRAYVLTILVGAYAFSLPIVLIAAVVNGSTVPEPGALAWSSLGGAAEAAAAGMLYLALASGTMGVASPLAAVVGATIPVAVGVASGERVAPAQAFGMLLAFGAITLVAAPQRSADAANRRTAALALASGVMFATSFIALSHAGAGSDPFWVAGTARITGLAIVVLLARIMSKPLVAPRGLRRLVAIVGLLDAAALILLLMAYGGGRLGLTTVLISLYPAVTVVLAALFLRERMARAELIGVGFALVAVTLLAIS